MTVAADTLPADWRDFFALTKPRVMSLVIFTGLCGLLAAPERIHPVLAFTAILCIAVGAGGSAARRETVSYPSRPQCGGPGPGRPGHN
jgi:protoheme IX farnesyltransferase